MTHSVAVRSVFILIVTSRKLHSSFTYIHNAFIQSSLQCIQDMYFISICILWELNCDFYVASAMLFQDNRGAFNGIIRGLYLNRLFCFLAVLDCY